MRFDQLRRIIAPAIFTIAIFTCALPCVGSAAAQTANVDETKLENSSRDWERILPVATNLKGDGAKANAAKKPILLFFNLQGCHFCRYSLRTVVVPMFRDAAWREAMEFRQITTDDERSLIDFDGKKVPNIDFAKARNGNFTPTIMLVDGDGKLLGDPIVGVASVDFYASYVDTLVKNAVETMRARK
jgi:thioredoxin-related protein